MSRSPIEMVADYAGTDFGAYRHHSRGMLVDASGERVSGPPTAKHVCQLCGMRSIAVVHPLHPETGVPWCQMPRIGW